MEVNTSTMAHNNIVVIFCLSFSQRERQFKFFWVYRRRYIRMDQWDDAMWDLEIDADLTDQKSE